MKRWIITVCLVVGLPLTLAAQIPIKTVPVATGGQFVLFPSQNAGMGGVTLALDDPLHDPFVNPARGIYTDGLRFASTPVFYNVAMENTEAANTGRTLPLGMMLRQGHLFGGAVMAWQELSQDAPVFGCCFRVDDVAFIDIAPEQRSISIDNLYVFGMAGMQMPGTGLSVGASAFVAGLNGIEGVQMLYVNDAQVEQSGTMSEFRLGLHQAWPSGQTADVTVVHHRFDMEHEMPRWDPEAMRMALHKEHDETMGWAVNTNFQQPLADGWRLGTLLAADWKWHPKIPNYDIMQIPRDPGNSSAYNIGLGMARHVGQASFGLDLIYEPIWSTTWADALTDTPTADNEDVIRAGEKTVHNDFRFHNTRLRMGVRRAGDRFEFGLGLDVHTYRYHLDQQNFVEQFERSQDERWSEWTGSLGLGLNFAEFQVRYLGLLTLGTGRPGIAMPWRNDLAFADAARAADIVVAPAGPLTLQDARVVTHQISIILPLTD